ncbi:MAG: tRNA pseudouridine(38-40) synthase TruA [Bradymonadaceae bacterium]
MRIRFHLTYDGTAYCGWQIQPDVPTVEGELTRAAATILDRRPDDVKVQGASRTDSGAHALGQVAHLQFDAPRSEREFLYGLNALTEDDICVNRVQRVPEDFHARFDARAKSYRFDIWNGRFPHPLRNRYTWQYGRELDVAPMRRAAEMFEGRHDFDGFRSANCQAETSVRTIERVEVRRSGAVVRVTVHGRDFLRYMVRVMVGTLVEVGSGREPPALVADVLESGERDCAGVTAPARGLTLLNVVYSEVDWRDPPPRSPGFDAPEC